MCKKTKDDFLLIRINKEDKTRFKDLCKKDLTLPSKKIIEFIKQQLKDL